MGIMARIIRHVAVVCSRTILVNAINLLLGSRGSGDLIRTGSQEATVTALFNLADEFDSTKDAGMLQDFGGGDLVVKPSRVSGRSRTAEFGVSARFALLEYDRT